MGGDEPEIYLSSGKPSGDKIKKIREFCPKLYRGYCMGEDGTLVFYFAQNPPMTLKGEIKRAIKLHAGMSMKIDLRKIEGLNEIEGMESTLGDKESLWKGFGFAETACDTSMSKLEERIDLLKNELEKTGDDRALKVAAGLHLLLDRMPMFKSELSAICNFSHNRDRSELIPLRKDLKKALDECRNYVNTNPLVAVVEKNPFVRVDFRRLVEFGLNHANVNCVEINVNA